MCRLRGDLPRRRGERANNTSGTLTGILRKPARITLALALALLFAVVLAASPAHAATTFTVNSTVDPGTGSCDAAECTLREAIAAANDLAGMDTINFNIPGSGVKTIAPTSELPRITGAVTIDGYTQGDGTADDATPNSLAIGNDAHLLIELDGTKLDGTNAGFLKSGLKITGANITVRGLVINRFPQTGILIGGPGNTIEGTFVGTDASGTLDLGNGENGVVVSGESNTIGGTTAASRNVISGNALSGVSIELQAATGNDVVGNYVGTDRNGTADLGNGKNGVHIMDAPDNTVGDTTTGARNVISGNNREGVLVFGAAATNNRIIGNYVGTEASGTTSLGNSSDGVLIDGGLGNWIGGTTEGARNVISGNGSAFGGSGVRIHQGVGNQVQGNYIGTDKDGTTSLGNRFRGVVISAAPNNTIGGTAPGAGNVISGNTLSGVFIQSDGNQVQGNYIGTDKNGTAPLGNSSEGVNIDSGSNNTVGGTVSGARNVISSNQGAGVLINSISNQVQGNYIGIDKNGTPPAGAPDLGNSGSGVVISSQGTNNTVGGTVAGARNVISDNNGSGVFIGGNSNQVQGNYVGTDASGTASLGNSFDGVEVGGINNSILSNAIFSNGELGIDLRGGTEDADGVTSNDVNPFSPNDDADTGPNNLQNFPDIGSASLNVNGTVTISGTLNSTPSTRFTIQLYSSPQADPSGFGEGKTFLGEKTDVVTDSGGDASFNFTSASAIPAGELVSATATDPSGNTSEFSEATAARDTTAPDPPVIAGPPNNSFDTDGIITLSGTAEPNSTIKVFDETIEKPPAVKATASGAWSKTLNGVTNGSHTYRAEATDSAGNTSGLSNARTVIVDTIKPTVSRVVPVENATGVAASANVSVFFSEPMRATSINRTTLQLYKKGSITPISADVRLDPANSRKAILDPRTALPNGYLQRGTTYKAVVTRGVKDRAGNALAAGKVWYFTVRP